MPHHGSRRNVSTPILDLWLGPRLPVRFGEGYKKFNAIISASKEDADHPKKAVVRACIHRGARVVSTEKSDIRVSHNAPTRGWTTAPALPYPEDQEKN
ncbi:hypothetical protein F4083_02280 [Candidatus Poribacteria bacterium]|nr:hypothetical protein [Candidatus Poribacteria bacterium]